MKYATTWELCHVSSLKRPSCSGFLFLKCFLFPSPALPPSPHTHTQTHTHGRRLLTSCCILVCVQRAQCTGYIGEVPGWKLCCMTHRYCAVALAVSYRHEFVYIGGTWKPAASLDGVRVGVESTLPRHATENNECDKSVLWDRWQKEVWTELSVVCTAVCACICCRDDLQWLI